MVLCKSHAPLKCDSWEWGVEIKIIALIHGGHNNV